jgi:hypothetical protein
VIEISKNHDDGGGGDDDDAAWLLCVDLPMGIETWVTFLLCWWAYRATHHRPRGSPHSWPVCCNMFSFGHLPASDFGGHSCGCFVVGPLGQLCGRCWIILYWGSTPNSRPQGKRNSLLNTRLTGVKPILLWVDAL